MLGTCLVAGSAGLLASYGLWESWEHRRHLRRIPIRVHVNGTRGKSGVTRLIAAGLRSAGVRTFAKTTGTLARKILPDGTEQPVDRIGRANVIEQVEIVRSAVRHRAEALVMECMALQPALQSLCELKLVCSTHGVITNARPDHMDIMGPTPRDVALALAGTVPRNAKLFTAETKWQHLFQTAATDRHSEMHALTPDDLGDISADEMHGFSYIEHPENVALALKVCTDLGIDRGLALQGMWSAMPDAGVMTKHEVSADGRQLVFVNGFAANDPQSTNLIWNLAMQHVPQAEKRIAVFNCREDRPDRSRQLAEMAAEWNTAHHLMLIGTGTHVFAHRASALGIPPQQMTIAEKWSASSVVQGILTQVDRLAMVMGIGNIGGVGMDVVAAFRDGLATQRPLSIA